jgi:PIN domain nuclease of toxin-antitoxin system
MSVLADTHTLLWWKGDPARLSRAARRALEREQPVLLSPISIWEISTLLRLGRIELDRNLFTWVQDVLAEDVALADLSAPAAAEAGSWDAEAFPADPADRLIYATAKDLSVPIVTKDARLHAVAAAMGDVRVIW